MKKKITKKFFREYLNELYKNTELFKNYQFHQVKREYGDYLYSQDKGRFDHYFLNFKRLIEKNDSIPDKLEFESEL